MNLKSATMATGLVLTFAAGAWLSTILLAPPQRPNRVAAQEQPPAPSPSPQLPPPRSLPGRLPDMPASDSILPPLPPLPPTPAATPPAPAPVAEAPVPKPVEQAAQPPEPQPQEPQPPEPQPPAIAEAPPPEPQPAPAPTPVAEAAPEPPALAIPLVPPVETTPEADIDPGIAALSDLVTRPPSAPPVPSTPSSPPPPLPPHRAAMPAPIRSHQPLRHPASRSPVPATSHGTAAGPYFTIQVGSFQDPANAASLDAEFRSKGVGSLRRGLGQQHRPDLEGCRVGRYQTETQAVSASAELMSAANLRGNVIKVR